MFNVLYVSMERYIYLFEKYIWSICYVLGVRLRDGYIKKDKIWFFLRNLGQETDM